MRDLFMSKLLYILTTILICFFLETSYSGNANSVGDAERLSFDFLPAVFTKRFLLRYELFVSFNNILFYPLTKVQSDRSKLILDDRYRLKFKKENA